MHVQGQWVAHDLMCQHCHTLGHKCYGLANKFCGQCQQDKKTCQDVVVEGELFSVTPVCLDTDILVVDSVPVIPPLKKVATKGKTVPHHMTQPRACKVMQVISPSPVVAGVPSPNPPIAGTSMVTQLPLFKEPVQLGGEEVGPVAPASSGEW